MRDNVTVSLYEQYEKIESLLKRLDNPICESRASLINDAIEALIVSKTMRPFIAEGVLNFGDDHCSH